MRHLCERFDVTDVAGGIADGFGKNGLGVLVDQPLDRVGLVAVGETSDNALTRQDVAEQRMRRAIKLRDRDNVPTVIGEIDESEMQRGLAGCDGERADAPLE